MIGNRGLKERRGRTVAFMGLDGTGKSTQTARLQRILASQGQKWLRVHHSSTKVPGIAYFKRRFHRKAIVALKRQGAHLDWNAGGSMNVRGSILSSPFILWLLLGSFAKALWYRWRFARTNVLFDRCFLDDVVKARWRFGDSSPLAPYLIRIVPRPELVIVLEGELSTSYARKKQKNCTYDEYVAKGRLLTLTLRQARDAGWTIRHVKIDGLTIDEVGDRVFADAARDCADGS